MYLERQYLGLDPFLEPGIHRHDSVLVSGHPLTQMRIQVRLSLTLRHGHLSLLLAHPLFPPSACLDFLLLLIFFVSHTIPAGVLSMA